ncbi:MAG: RDD family protein [Cyanobacteria bacterium J06600_6]
MRFFNQINLQTPESVELEFTLAGVGNRSFALLIDYIIVWLSIILVWVLGFFLMFQLSPIFSDNGGFNKLSQWIFTLQYMTAFGISVGYFVVLETIWQGQTLGKKWTKIRVIRDNGKPARLPQAIMRGLLRPIDLFTTVGAFFIIFSQQEKRLGDLLAGTLVVQEEGSQLAKIAISEAAENLAVQLRIEAEMDNLLPDDFATIRDFLQRRKNIMLEYQHQLSRKLAEQVLEIILLEAIPEGYSNSQLLEATYLAYQQENPSAY